jgi:RNA polymerase sigma-70 factor, ECF subfamily
MVDEDLIRRVKQKDKEAFRKMYELCKEKVYYTAYSIVRDKGLAEDVLQEVFVKVYIRIDDIKLQYKFDAWLYRITVNTAKDVYSKKRDVLWNPVGEEGDYIEVADTSEESLPEEVVLKSEVSKELMKEVYALPEYHRVPLVLYFFNNLNIEDIAYAMECSTGTVKSRLFHGKKALKKRLAKFYEEYTGNFALKGSVKIYENR